MEFYTHRGYHGNTIIENTIQAFEKSIEYGFGIELDVRITKDYQVVVAHDDSLLRIYKHDVLISNLNYVDIEAITRQSVKIPLFTEVLKLVDGRVPLIIELKGGNNNPGLCRLVSIVLDDYNGRFSVESFDPRIVRWFLKNRPHFERGQLLMNVSLYKPKILGVVMSLGLTSWYTKPQYYAFHKMMGSTALGKAFYTWLARNKKCYVWTVSRNEVPNLDVDGIIFEDLEGNAVYE